MNSGLHVAAGEQDKGRQDALGGVIGGRQSVENARVAGGGLDGQRDMHIGVLLHVLIDRVLKRAAGGCILRRVELRRDPDLEFLNCRGRGRFFRRRFFGDFNRFGGNADGRFREFRRFGGIRRFCDGFAFTHGFGLGLLFKRGRDFIDSGRLGGGSEAADDHPNRVGRVFGNAAAAQEQRQAEEANETYCERFTRSFQHNDTFLFILL